MAYRIDHTKMLETAEPIGHGGYWSAETVESLAVHYRDIQAKYAALETAAREWNRTYKLMGAGDLKCGHGDNAAALAALLDTPAVAPAKPSAIEVAAREWAEAHSLECQIAAYEKLLAAVEAVPQAKPAKAWCSTCGVFEDLELHHQCRGPFRFCLVCGSRLTEYGRCDKCMAAVEATK